MAEHRKSGFVLVSTLHGTMIVNRFDVQKSPIDGSHYGVGHDLLETGGASINEISVILRMLRERRKHFGEQVMMLDCGANIGAHTVALASEMTSWGRVCAFEPQERVFYALAGNLALNNCFNAQAFYAAVGATNGTISVPHLNFLEPASYGSLELHQRDLAEDIGQPIDYHNAAPVRLVTIDSLNLRRLDLIKLDVEGMELEALHGAEDTLERLSPILFIEFIKTNQNDLAIFLEDRGYSWIPYEINIIGIHKDDPCHKLLESLDHRIS